MSNAWGDAAGDTKVEYNEPEGRSVVLKLKTAPDVAGGILDQYELGPYNLMILGEPSRWRGEFKAFFDSGIVQTVTTMAPCSVLVARNSLDRRGFFICTDGSSRAMQAVRRAAVLAHMTGEPITLFSVAPDAAAQTGRRRSRGQCQGPAQGHEDRSCVKPKLQSAIRCRKLLSMARSIALLPSQTKGEVGCSAFSRARLQQMWFAMRERVC